MENKFTWGDAVTILNDAPNHIYSGEIASVCGFYKIISQEAAKAFCCSIGDWIYTVEFADGKDIQIAEPYLKLYNT